MDSAPTFVRPATFGQLTEKTFSTIYRRKPHECGLGSLSPISPESGCPGLRSKTAAARLQSISGQNREHPRWKPRATFWFWKAYYRNCAGFGDLIEIGKQLDLIMVCAENVRFKRVIVFAGGDSRIGICRLVT